MKKIPSYLAFLLLITTACVLLTGCKKSAPEKEEIRALWLHPGLFNSNEDTALLQITGLFDSYREIGINNLFCYNTLKWQNGFKWDYLQALIDEGHKRGISIHPIFYPGYDVKIEGEIKDHPEWLIKSIDSTVMPNLNLTMPAVKKYWLMRISEALKYDIDGIHLDYTRFPIDQKYSYDSITISAFKKIYGVSPLEVSPDCGNIFWCEWIRWNADQITGLVGDIRHLLDNSGRKILLGADAFPDSETSRVLIGQDWVKWAREGFIDILCPMLYTNDTTLYSTYLDKAISETAGYCTVVAGTGIITAENRITNRLLVSEIISARKAGAGGVAFFSGYSFTKELRDTLKMTVFK